MNRTLVVVPTYNEALNLPNMLGRILAAVPHAEVLVVDDNSPDGTGDLADQVARVDPRVHVLHRPGKQGLGAAYRAGFAWGLEHGAEVLVEMDADGSHDPAQLPRLLGALDEGADVAVGSRWVPGGSVVGWALRRKALSRAGSLYARFALGLPHRDITGGYRAFRAPALRRIRADQVTSTGYCFQIEMLWRACSRGLAVTEVPITFSEREYGYSKMSGDIVVEAMARVTVWGLRALPHRLLGRGAVRSSVTAGTRSDVVESRPAHV